MSSVKYFFVVKTYTCQTYMPLKEWKYFGPFEVVVHNTSDDCWVSFLGKVFNVTPVIQEHRHERIVKPLLAMAGKDISHWFDESTGDLQYRIHPVTGNRVPYLPHGRIPDVPVEVPDSTWRPELEPWWKNEEYQVGLLTKRVRTIRIMNMLIFKEVYLKVCCEETFNQIAERYSTFCKDYDSYLWKHDNRRINMYKTLDGNGIFDERDKFCDMGLPANTYIPSILLYYQSDFKHLSDDTDSEKECEITSIGRSTQISLQSAPILIDDKDSFAYYLSHQMYPEEYQMDEHLSDTELVPHPHSLSKLSSLDTQTKEYLKDIESPQDVGEADEDMHYPSRTASKQNEKMVELSQEKVPSQPDVEGYTPAADQEPQESALEANIEGLSIKEDATEELPKIEPIADPVVETAANQETVVQELQDNEAIVQEPGNEDTTAQEPARDDTTALQEEVQDAA